MATRVTLVAGLLGIIGGGLAFMDSRHASSSEVQDLVHVIRGEQVNRIEFEIESVERAYKILKSIQVDDRTASQEIDLLDLEAKKERYLRKLDRINAEMSK
jgi:hypothetical protein